MEINVTLYLVLFLCSSELLAVVAMLRHWVCLTAGLLGWQPGMSCYQERSLCRWYHLLVTLPTIGRPGLIWPPG